MTNLSFNKFDSGIGLGPLCRKCLVIELEKGKERKFNEKIILSQKSDWVTHRTTCLEKIKEIQSKYVSKEDCRAFWHNHLETQKAKAWKMKNIENELVNANRLKNKNKNTLVNHHKYLEKTTQWKVGDSWWIGRNIKDSVKKRNWFVFCRRIFFLIIALLVPFSIGIQIIIFMLILISIFFLIISNIKLPAQPQTFTWSIRVINDFETKYPGDTKSPGFTPQEFEEIRAVKDRIHKLESTKKKLSLDKQIGNFLSEEDIDRKVDEQVIINTENIVLINELQEKISWFDEQIDICNNELQRLKENNSMFD